MLSLLVRCFPQAVRSPNQGKVDWGTSRMTKVWDKLAHRKTVQVGTHDCRDQILDRVLS